MVMKVDGPAGYAPGKTITALIERFRNAGLPSPLTIESLQRVSVTESLAPRTLQTLKLLDLVDEQGKPTQQFEDLRRAPTTEFKSELITLLKFVYADVFEVVEPANATLEQIQDAFRSFTPQGQRDRMVSLFLSLLEYAEYSDDLPSVRSSGGTRSTDGSSNPPRANRAAKASSSRSSRVQTVESANTAPTNAAWGALLGSHSVPRGEQKVITLGTAGVVTINVNVRWLDLPDDKFVALRKVIRDLEALGSHDSAPPEAAAADYSETADRAS